MKLAFTPSPDQSGRGLPHSKSFAIARQRLGVRQCSAALVRHDKNESAIALVIVMISIFVLSILAGGFAYSMKVETKLARNANSETELEWLGRSGVEYAKWILAQQLTVRNEPYDALNQVWAGGTGGIGTSNSPLADVVSDVHLGNGSFTWKIKDLERKYNINRANEQVLQQALVLMGASASDTTPIVNCILDWMDNNKSSRVEGAKDDYYQSLVPPYYAKNGPIDDMSELLLIKGITPDVYWGISSTNHVQAAFQQQQNRFAGKPGAPMIYPVGLVDLFAPLGAGKININTASAAVLQLVPGVDSTVAEAIVGGRGGEDDGSGLLGPYRSVDEVQRVPEVPRALIAVLRNFCDVHSRTFEVEVDAEVGGYHRHFIATIGRNNPRDVQVLTFYWK
jgi:general secretion pathway protein K